MQVKTSRQLFDIFDKERKRAQRSDRDIARAVNISAATAGQIRKRGGNMQTDTMLALAKELGLTVKVER